MKLKLLIIAFGLLVNFSFAQIGGSSTYEFLNLSTSARTASLGGNNISLFDNDLNLVFSNPAALSDSMTNHLVYNFVNYFSTINYGYFSYAKTYKKYGNFAAGVHHVNYGEFTEANETGVILGSFSASEYSLNLTWSQKLTDKISFGTSLKTILSILGEYNSNGIAVDAGVLYYNPDKLFSSAIVLKNFGGQIKPFIPGNREPIPADIQIGITKGLKHAPLRFSLTAQNLLEYNMSFDNPNEKEETSLEPSTEEPNNNLVADITDEVFRHIIIGAEIIPMKNFFLNVGYNYQRRQELKIATRTSIVGFSFGFGIKISKFYFSYGRSTYHLAGASNLFSIRTNLNDFYKKN